MIKRNNSIYVCQMSSFYDISRKRNCLKFLIIVFWSAGLIKDAIKGLENIYIEDSSSTIPRSFKKRMHVQQKR